MSKFLKELEKRGITNSDELYDAVNDGLEGAMSRISINLDKIEFLQQENRVLLQKIQGGVFNVNRISKAIAPKV